MPRSFRLIDWRNMSELPWWSYWVAVFICLFAIGFVSLARRLVKTVNAMDYLQEYERRFSDVANPSVEDDGESRTWLITNAEKMMNLMGVYGALYSQATGQINVALNLVPDLCFELGSEGVTSFIQQEQVNAVHKSLLVFHGSLNESYEAQKKRMGNPLRWLSEGVSLVLRIPILVAKSLGLFAESRADKIVGSRFWEMLSGIASLATIAGFILDLLTRANVISPLFS